MKENFWEMIRVATTRTNSGAAGNAARNKVFGHTLWSTLSTPRELTSSIFILTKFSCVHKKNPSTIYYRSEIGSETRLEFIKCLQWWLW